MKLQIDRRTEHRKRSLEFYTLISMLICIYMFILKRSSKPMILNRIRHALNFFELLCILTAKTIFGFRNY